MTAIDVSDKALFIIFLDFIFEDDVVAAIGDAAVCVEILDDDDNTIDNITRSFESASFDGGGRSVALLLFVDNDNDDRNISCCGTLCCCNGCCGS